MTSKIVVDGSTFWNPYQGLRVAADLLRLVENSVSEGRWKPPEGSADDSLKVLRRIAVALKEVTPKVKAAMQAWVDVRFGLAQEPRPMKLTTEEIACLDTLQFDLRFLWQPAMTGPGPIRLQDLAIDYCRHEVRFDPESYFAFALRSVEEVLAAAESGKLRGPTAAQSW